MIEVRGRRWITSAEGAEIFGRPSGRAFREWADRAGFPSIVLPGSSQRLWDLGAIEARIAAEGRGESA